MKKILILLFLIPHIHFAQEEKIIDNNDVIEKDGILVLKSDLTLITGKVNYWYDNGQLKEEVNIKNGKLNGIGKKWYENGQLSYEAMHINGIANGVSKKYNESGQLLRQIPKKDGKIDGVANEWYENGQLKREVSWKDDKIG